MNTKQLLCRPNNNVISVITQVSAVMYWYKKWWAKGNAPYTSMNSFTKRWVKTFGQQKKVGQLHLLALSH